MLAHQGLELTPELADQLLSMVDLDKYTEIVGSEFLARADFTEIKRVDKIMKSDEFNKVIIASQQVSDAVHEERLRILSVLIPDDEEEVAE